MTINNKQKWSAILIFSALNFVLIVSAEVFASEPTLPKTRVFYRPDGGVSIMRFVSAACRAEEAEVQCMDRIAAESPHKDFPYDDLPIDQIPKDRKDRDEWRGEKGRGIWIDESLVTKNEKIEELEEKLDEELEQDNPNTGKVLKLQHKLEKAKKINHSVLSQDDLAQFEERQRSFIAAAIETVGGFFADILNGIKEGFLALKNLVIGSPEKPSGITTYDHETGKPYCVIVKGGKVESIPGECGDSSVSPQNDNSSVIPSEATESQDTQSPTITLNGLNPTEIEIGSVYSDMGATVSDNVNQNLGYKVKLDDGEEIYPNGLTLDTSVAGEHTLTYIAVDQAGNIGTATRTIRVIASEAKQSNNDSSDPNGESVILNASEGSSEDSSASPQNDGQQQSEEPAVEQSQEIPPEPTTEAPTL